MYHFISGDYMKKTDKRYEANKIVKEKIGKALIKLMNQKPFSEITVTDIISEAQVARASYYRNFDSKEEVLIRLTDDLMALFKRRVKQVNAELLSYQYILLMFQYCRHFKNLILPVFHSGLAYIYLDLFDRELEENLGDMKYNDVKRYSVYFYSGALYNVLLKWLENDMKESPKAMAEIVVKMAQRSLPSTDSEESTN